MNRKLLAVFAIALVLAVIFNLPAPAIQASPSLQNATPTPEEEGDTEEEEGEEEVAEGEEIAEAEEDMELATQPPNAPAGQAMPGGAGIVQQVHKAPVVADGDVAGSITDFVIDFDISADPDVPGLTLLEGQSTRVTLPDEFVNSQEPALADAGSGDDCVPSNLKCTTGVLLQG